jgi:hypothetical protein
MPTMQQTLYTRRLTLSRNYQNLKEGVIEHDGGDYIQPDTDKQFVLTVELGNLIYVDDLFEIWVWQGMAVILRNEIGLLE